MRPTLPLLATAAAAAAAHRPWPQWMQPHVDRMMATQPATLPAWMQAAEGELRGYLEMLGVRDELLWRAGHNPIPDSYWRCVPLLLNTTKGGATATFSAPCFQSGTLSVPVVNGSSATALLTVSNPVNATCSDGFFIATIDGFDLVTADASKGASQSFTVTLPVSSRAGAQQWLAREGFRLFQFLDPSPVDTVLQVLSTMSLFLPSLITAPLDSGSISRNMEFLQGYAGISFDPTPSSTPLALPESYFSSGDVMVVFRPDGLGTLEMWGTGARSTHTTAFLWGQGNETGNLYVVESTDATPDWNVPNIQKTLWKDWAPMAMFANYSAVHLRLSDASKASFNVSQAWAFVNSQLGYPYGYFNFIYTFVDTERDNLPWPVTPEAIEVVFGLLDALAPNLVRMLLGQGMNHRLGAAAVAANLTFLEAVNQAAQVNGLTFGQLLAQPEQDEWVYAYEGSILKPGPFIAPSGPSSVCDVFLCKMFKATGVLGAVGQQINCGEFHNADLYTLAIFNMSTVGLPSICNATADMPWCQLLGPFRVALPGAGATVPYPHMAETCPSLPTAYTKPAGC